MMNVIKIHPRDNVLIALNDIKKDEFSETYSVRAAENVNFGHKIALQKIKKDEPVIKYGCCIGTASQDINPGEWVHTHNVKTTLDREQAISYDFSGAELTLRKPDLFEGFRREDGRAGVRNEIWIIPTVGCVNSIAQRLAEENKKLIFGSIDGIYAFTHPYGCSQLGGDHAATRKILADLAKHPNAGGVLVVGLGCENLTMEQFKAELGTYDENRIKFLTCQECDDEIETGSAYLRELTEYVSSFTREKIPASELVIGLKCGGSDGLSGITANSVVGCLSDKLIAVGGSAILTEVPEMFGAESILFNRCISEEVFNSAVKMVEDYKSYFLRNGQTVYENPSPGNKAGGITTLEDKSCGCVQKGGNAPVVDVLAYGDTVTKKGLNLLYGPGNDLVSTTALTAAGANIILFTTGRGTPFGAPVPTIKVSSNSVLYKNKMNWIDFDAGVVASGTSIESVGDDLYALLMKTASGKKTKNEMNNYREIAIFKNGITL